MRLNNTTTAQIGPSFTDGRTIKPNSPAPMKEA